MRNKLLIDGFEQYLRLENALSENTVEAYLRDVAKLQSFAGDSKIEHLDKHQLGQFVITLNELGVNPLSQARILSGIRRFYDYLLTEQIVNINPMESIDMPKTGRKLPVVLTYDEIMSMIAAIDKTRKEAERNIAIIETLYACGLRVSELTSLRISDIFFHDKFLKVIGKGNKERLVPIDDDTLEQLSYFIHRVRVHWPIKKEAVDKVFINQKGGALSRISVFTLIKDLAKLAGIHKTVSPHTFRHSFATHMVENGADLRAVQQMLGHESITTTEIYTHLDRQFLRNTVEKYHPHAKKY